MRISFGFRCLMFCLFCCYCCCSFCCCSLCCYCCCSLRYYCCRCCASSRFSSTSCCAWPRACPRRTSSAARGAELMAVAPALGRRKCQKKTKCLCVARALCFGSICTRRHLEQVRLDSLERPMCTGPKTQFTNAKFNAVYDAIHPTWMLCGEISL